MTILLDTHGGDHAPHEIIKGARLAEKKLGVNVVLVDGDKLPMDADPASILKQHKDSSMAMGLRMLVEGKGDAFVSAGNTGALLVGATIWVKRVRGVRRPCIAAVLPTATTPCVLLDCGANADCTADMLDGFAQLGSVYAKAALGLANPRVGLINNGTEANKGDKLRQEAHALLRENPHINFTGNIEARELPHGGCDVAVADGFTGNVALKLYEGMGGMMKRLLLRHFSWNPLAWPSLLRLRRQLDYKQHGGAPLLGLNGVVIKAHGSSDATAVYHAIRQAKACIENDMVDIVKGAFS